MKTDQEHAWHPVRREVSRLFSLKEDKADDADIDKSLRGGVEIRGTNLWVLMFAIFVASIGLNVNSTAVIIGAMLISPLMGPIMGVGYGVGVSDFQLVRTALKNLGIAILISLATSVVYFLITPLSGAQSELLARTTPNIWDVLIALFGGLAGIVGATRKEKSNVIPGVAIATALMPPLCTAGYGIANTNWAFFGGAFYLFSINSVFIALSSALVVRALHVERKHFVDEGTTRRVKTYVTIVATLTLVPSIYLAYALVQDEVFKSRAVKFVANEVASDKTYVTQTDFNPKSKTIAVTVIGAYLTEEHLAVLAGRLAEAGLSQAKLEVHQQANQERIDVGSLKAGLLSDLYGRSQLALEKKDQRIRELQETIQRRGQLDEQLKQIPQELHAIFPQISEVWLAQATVWEQSSGLQADPVLVLNLRTTDAFSAKDRVKVENWLLARLQIKAIKLVVSQEGKRSFGRTARPMAVR